MLFFLTKFNIQRNIFSWKILEKIHSNNYPIRTRSRNIIEILLIFCNITLIRKTNTILNCIIRTTHQYFNVNWLVLYPPTTLLHYYTTVSLFVFEFKKERALLFKIQKLIICVCICIRKREIFWKKWTHNVRINNRQL